MSDRDQAMRADVEPTAEALDKAADEFDRAARLLYVTRLRECANLET